MLLEVSGKGPMYRQIYQAFKQAILNQSLKAGEKIPSSRDLAQLYQCSRNTVVNAYEQLHCEGYIESKYGVGSFVAVLNQPGKAELGKESLASYEVLSQRAKNIATEAHNYLNNFRKQPKLNFQYGNVSLDAISRRHWQRLLKLHSHQFEQNYDQVKGNLQLRTAIADHLRLNRAVICDPQQIIITNGSQQALNLIARCFIDPNDIVITEDPCYLGATLAFQSAEADIRRIRVDEQGLDIQQYHGQTAKLIYLTPSHQYPTGVVMSANRRLKVIDWAKQNNSLIIEDDYDSEFRYEGQPVSSIHNLDNNHHTIYIGTFSKSLYPALRIGYIVVPENLIDALTGWKWNEDRHCGSFLQPVLADFISQGHYARHIKRMRNVYAEKRAHLKHCLKKYLADRQSHGRSPAGLHLLVWLNQLPAVRLAEFLEKTLEKNLGFYPVNHLYQQSPANIGLVMGYTPLSLNEIEQGISLLAQVIDNADK